MVQDWLEPDTSTKIFPVFCFNIILDELHISRLRGGGVEIDNMEWFKALSLKTIFIDLKWLRILKPKDYIPKVFKARKY